MAGKIYVGVLMDSDRRVPGVVIDYEQGNFRSKRGSIDNSLI